jgi:hypothetical protein
MQRGRTLTYVGIIGGFLLSSAPAFAQVSVTLSAPPPPRVEIRAPAPPPPPRVVVPAPPRVEVRAPRVYAPPPPRVVVRAPEPRVVVRAPQPQVVLPPPPRLHFEAQPELVVVQPGVQVVADADEEVFYSSGWYWHAGPDGTWWRARHYRDGWVVAPRHAVPRVVMHLPQGHYKHYRVESRHQRHEVKHYQKHEYKREQHHRGRR